MGVVQENIDALLEIGYPVHFKLDFICPVQFELDFLCPVHFKLDFLYQVHFELDFLCLVHFQLDLFTFSFLSILNSIFYLLHSTLYLRYVDANLNRLVCTIVWSIKLLHLSLCPSLDNDHKST